MQILPTGIVASEMLHSFKETKFLVGDIRLLLECPRFLFLLQIHEKLWEVQPRTTKCNGYRSLITRCITIGRLSGS